MPSTPTTQISLFTQAVFKQAIKKPVYAYQRQILDDDNNRTIVNKSRQTGISTIAALKGLLLALAGRTVLLVSPSQRQSKHLMDYVKQFLQTIKDFELENNGKKVSLVLPMQEETKTGMIFNNGGQIHSLPNSASTIRGFKADYVVLDEFAHFLNDTDKEVWDAIVPSTSRGGKVLIISTPFGENNQYYKIWHEEKDTWNKILITHEECEDLDIEGIRGTMDEASFAQEYCNAFLGEMDSYFPYDLIKKCIDPELPLDSTDVHYLGVDFARKYDLTAIIGAKKILGIHALDIRSYEIRLVQAGRNIPFKTQLDSIKVLLENPNVERATLDAGGLGMPLAEQLQQEHSAKVVPVTFTNEIKERLMTNLKRLFEQKKITIPNHTPLINSLHAISLKQTESQHFVFNSPRDEEIGHADLAWALSLALMNVEQAKPVFKIF